MASPAAAPPSRSRWLMMTGGVRGELPRGQVREGRAFEVGVDLFDDRVVAVGLVRCVGVEHVGGGGGEERVEAPDGERGVGALGDLGTRDPFPGGRVQDRVRVGDRGSHVGVDAVDGFLHGRVQAHGDRHIRAAGAGGVDHVGVIEGGPSASSCRAGRSAVFSAPPWPRARRGGSARLARWAGSRCSADSQPSSSASLARGRDLPDQPMARCTSGSMATARKSTVT